jgi:hypothetical protein
VSSDGAGMCRDIVSVHLGADHDVERDPHRRQPMRLFSRSDCVLIDKCARRRLVCVPCTRWT